MWDPSSSEHATAATNLQIWPLDEYNATLLNEVHHKNFEDPTPQDGPYDLVVIGSGAGGLVSSKQSGRRGANKVALISAHLAGGDCLNVGCVPSKALIRAAKLAAEVRSALKPDNEYGIVTSTPVSVSVDFAKVMQRMRRLRAKISPADGHKV